MKIDYKILVFEGEFFQWEGSYYLVFKEKMRMSEQPGVWRNGKKISENRVVGGGGGSRGKNDGNIGESQQHQHSTAAEQQQRVSDTMDEWELADELAETVAYCCAGRKK